MQASAEKIWEFAQQHLRSMLSADTFKLWFEALRAVTLDGNTLVLEVSNDFCEVWLKDNYMGLLQDVVALAAGRQLQIKFKVGSASSIGTPARAGRRCSQTKIGGVGCGKKFAALGSEFQSEEHLRHLCCRQ